MERTTVQNSGRHPDGNDGGDRPDVDCRSRSPGTRHDPRVNTAVAGCRAKYAYGQSLAPTATAVTGHNYISAGALALLLVV